MTTTLQLLNRNRIPKTPQRWHRWVRCQKPRPTLSAQEIRFLCNAVYTEIDRKDTPILEFLSKPTGFIPRCNQHIVEFGLCIICGRVVSA